VSRPPFVLRVLGSPALHGPDGEAVTFRTKKHFALLIYLALEPQLHRREKLGALLWPGATTSEARHSLATGLSVLRGYRGQEDLAATQLQAIRHTLVQRRDRLDSGPQPRHKFLCKPRRQPLRAVTRRGQEAISVQKQAAI
jgi:hypothetical protein